MLGFCYETKQGMLHNNGLDPRLFRRYVYISVHNMIRMKLLFRGERGTSTHVNSELQRDRKQLYI
jgi:hypothetical protein